MSYRLVKSSWVPMPLEEAWDFFSDPANLKKLTPENVGFQMLDESVEMREGARINYRIRVMGLPMRWQTLISRWEPPRLFEDTAPISPYKSWKHTHRFEAENGGTRITDEIEYELPFGPLGAIAHALFVRRQLEGIFAYRERRVKELLGAAG